MQRIAPDRVLLYGCVDTFDDDRGRVFESMERMVEQGAVGFKFYPSNGFFDVSKHKLVQMLYDDPERAFPFFEKARELGVMHLAFHKAQPVGPGPVEAVHYEDVSTAALAFPDMTFEVVHAGWAFLEEAGIQLMLHDNIYANLECVVNLVVRHPRRFAHIIGTLLRYGGPERILYATGCAVNHADPILERFMAFEMPEELVDGYGLSGADRRCEASDAGRQHRPHPRPRCRGHREKDRRRPLGPASRARQGGALERAPGAAGGRRGRVLKEAAAMMGLRSRDQVDAYVRERINEVTDPCSQALGVAIGLGDMGLVRALEVEPHGAGWSVRVTLRLTSPGCLYFVYFEESIRERIVDPAIERLEISFDSGLDWTPEAMAPSAQRRLRAYRSRLLNGR